MGRVAKYKKVKSFDPYSKKNRGNIDLPTVGIWGLGDNGRRPKKRSQKAERMHAKKNKFIDEKKLKKKVDDGGFDMPPMENDEFDMADLTGSIKRQKVETNNILASYTISTTNDNVGSSSKTSNHNNNNDNGATNESYDKIVTSTGIVANIPKTDQDENKVTRLLRLDTQEEQKSEKAKQLSHARMVGESKRAYAKRTRAETRKIIKQSTKTINHEKLQRKKEFLKLKKKNKKRKGGGSYSLNGDGNNEITYDYTSNNDKHGIDGDCSHYDAAVRFGEQALRPPTFRQIPRGAKRKVNTKSQAEKSTKSEFISNDQIKAERDAMELMRRRVQARYKAMKSNRKDAGDFHL